MNNSYNRILVILILICISTWACREIPQQEIKQAESVNMVQAFPGLFEEVQMAGIFSDSKTFADASPKKSPQAILALYQNLKGQPDFLLEEFIAMNFELPPSISSNFQSDTSRSLSEHINTLWPVLTRNADVAKGFSSRIPLPNPYVVPGGRFREIYYWDTYFTMLGLQVSDSAAGMIRPMVENFAYLIDTIGFIPNGSRTYYLGRSQPPFFPMMVSLLAELEGEQVLTEFRLPLELEYNFWMRNGEKLHDTRPALKRVVRLKQDVYLNRYWDDRPSPRPESYKEDVELAEHSDRPEEELFRDLRAACESGWDFSSRWLKDGETLASIHTSDIIPVDLNSLLFHLEMVLHQAYKLEDNEQMANQYKTKADMRKKAMVEYLWNEKEGTFLDYDWKLKASTSRLSLACVFPLYLGIASQEQADKTREIIEETFLSPGGVVSTPYETGQQWDAPNGWAPLQWATIVGLRNYGHDDLATIIKNRWINLNYRVYKATGKLVEKYNVMDMNLEAGGGEYPVQDGFGWTNGVLLRLLSE